MTTTQANLGELLDRLSAEHEELLPRVDELVGLAEARNAKLGTTIEELKDLLGEALDTHIGNEDDIVFPAYAESSGNETLVQQFLDEHREIQSLRDELTALAASGADAQGLASVTLRLADILHSHMQREDMMLFPAVRNTLG